MSLVEAVLASQRERETAEEFEADRTCRSPTCDRKISHRNNSGFCYLCRKYYPGRRWYLKALGKWKNALKLQATWAARRQRTKKAAGQCRRCDELAAPGHRHCRRHLEIVAAERRKQRAARAVAGKCPRCPRASAPGKKWCETCCAKEAARYLVRKARARVRELLAQIPGRAA